MVTRPDTVNDNAQSGEETGSQHPPRNSGAIAAGGGLSMPPRGSFRVYRLMRQSPTIKMGRVAAMAPVTSTDWSFVENDGAPAGAVDLVRRSLDPIMGTLVRSMFEALDFGYKPHEIVWDIHQSGDDRGKLYPRKIKPLLPDITEVLVDKTTGAFGGLRQAGSSRGTVNLPPIKSFLFTNEQECGDFYGVSRHEGIRVIWSNWRDALRRMGNYTGRVAGGVPVVGYEPGVSKDKSGAERSNYELAVGLMAALEQGKGVALPRTVAAWAEQYVTAGGSIGPEIFTWLIDTMEPKSSHGSDFETVLAIYDALQVRGWCVPERSVFEGKHGTKAEAGEHADIGLACAENTLFDMAQTINWHLIDKLLVVNYGPEARGTVCAEPAPLVDEKLAFVREILKAVLTSPSSVDLFGALLDVEAMIDQAGLPTPDGEADTESLLARANFADDAPLAASMATIYGHLADEMRKAD